MKKTVAGLFYSLIIVFLFTQNCLSQSNNAIDSNHAIEQKVDKKKLAVVLGASTLTLGASYIYVQNAWWKNNEKSFHFDNGPDYKYAKNLDKCAHVMGGLITAELVHDALKWTGINDNN
jgi:hypothetical protein